MLNYMKSRRTPGVAGVVMFDDNDERSTITAAAAVRVLDGTKDRRPIAVWVMRGYASTTQFVTVGHSPREVLRQSIRMVA